MEQEAYLKVSLEANAIATWGLLLLNVCMDWMMHLEVNGFGYKQLEIFSLISLASEWLSFLVFALYGPEQKKNGGNTWNSFQNYGTALYENLGMRNQQKNNSIVLYPNSYIDNNIIFQLTNLACYNMMIWTEKKILHAVPWLVRLTE